MHIIIYHSRFDRRRDAKKTRRQQQRGEFVHPHASLHGADVIISVEVLRLVFILLLFLFRLRLHLLFVSLSSGRLPNLAESFPFPLE